MKKLLTIIILLAVMAASCTKPDPTLEISFDKPEQMIVVPGSELTIGYTIKSGLKDVDFVLKPGSGIVSANLRPSAVDALKGEILLRFAGSFSTAVLELSLSHELNAITAKFTFEAETLMRDSAGAFNLGPEGGVINLDFKTNVPYKLSIPSNAASWVKESSSKAVSSYGIGLEIAPNDGYDRATTVTVECESGSSMLSYNITQLGVQTYLVFDSTLDSVELPEIFGQNLSGKIRWNNLGAFSLWEQKITHEYVGEAVPHTVTMEMLGAEGFSFGNLSGISRINIKEF